MFVLRIYIMGILFIMTKKLSLNNKVIYLKNNALMV